jgi:acetyltransferase-like isoleucine patch superfamily enzyme
MRQIKFKNIIRHFHNRRNFNKINWLKTLVINFFLLPFNIARKLPIFIYGKCELGVLSGDVIFLEPPYKGMLKIGITDPFRSVESTSFIQIQGTIELGKQVVLRRGIHMHIAGLLRLEDHVYIGDNNSICAGNQIRIGTGTRVGNNTTFIDTDFHYIVNIQNNSIKNNTSPVEIGAQNWIGGNCIIKKGTKTPKGTIIAGPYSMTSKDYTQIIEEYSLIAGSPAKILIKNVRRVNNIQSEKVLYEHFKNTTEQYIVSPDEFETFCLPTND